jgi:DNA-binding NtrC family response regulator
MISKKIIEDLHKGKILVHSEIGKGSVFSVLLPTASTILKTIDINKAQKDAKKILIVEDNQNYQKILSNHLENNYHLTITNSINHAKHLLEENSYDFIILDFFLLDGIGSEILQFMDDEKIDIPTVVISAEDDVKISSSLTNFSNLDGILKKDHIDEICRVINQETKK